MIAGDRARIDDHRLCAGADDLPAPTRLPRLGRDAIGNRIGIDDKRSKRIGDHGRIGIDDVIERRRDAQQAPPAIA